MYQKNFRGDQNLPLVFTTFSPVVLPLTPKAHIRQLQEQCATQKLLHYEFTNCLNATYLKQQASKPDTVGRRGFIAYDIFIFLLDVTRKSHPRYGYLSSQMKGFTYIEMYTLVRIDGATYLFCSSSI